MPRKSPRRWLVVCAALLVVGAAIFVFTRSTPPPQSEPEAPTPQQAAAQKPPAKSSAEIVRPSHSAVAENSPRQAAADSSATSPSGSEASVAPEVVPKELPVLTTERRKQLNQGLTMRASGPAHDGELVLAKVSIQNETYNLTPNRVGNFQRVHVSANEMVAVNVDYVQGHDGEAVSIMVLDGGQLDNGQPTKRLVLGEDKRLAFNFQVTEQRGVHRVKLSKGADQKLLDFWVGEPLPLQQ